MDLLAAGEWQLDGNPAVSVNDRDSGLSAAPTCDAVIRHAVTVSVRISAWLKVWEACMSRLALRSDVPEEFRCVITRSVKPWHECTEFCAGAGWVLAWHYTSGMLLLDSAAGLGSYMA